MHEEQAYTLKKVTHCNDCGVCVEDWDHHCGVFDRCIGSDNILLFHGVLIAFFVNMGYLIVALAAFGPDPAKAS